MMRLGAGILALAVSAAGCSGGGGGGAPAVVGTTRGQVLFRNRQPPTEAQVRVTGCRDQVTAADGSFDTTCALTTPYDVAVSYANVGVVYRGLTWRRPVVTLPFELGGPQGGSASGSATGLTGGRAAAVAVTSAEAAEDFQATTGTFSDYLQWFGAPPSATVRVLEWTPSTGLPGTFTGYAATPVTLQDGADVQVSPALGSTASGTISISSNAVSVGDLTYGLWATWPDGGLTEITSASPASAATTIATPDVTGVSFAVAAERGLNPTSWGWRRGLAATSAPPEITLPSAPVFTAPAPGSTVSASTDFTFGGLADAVYLVAFESSSGSPLLYVVTSDTTARIPDFSWAGLTLPAATALTARVYAMGPCASVDDASRSTDPLTLLPTAWRAANGVPAADGFASRYTMSVTTR